MDYLVLALSALAAGAAIAAFWRAGQTAATDPALFRRLDASEASQAAAREKTEAQLRQELATARQEADARERATREEAARRFDAFQAGAFQKFDALMQAQKTGLDAAGTETKTLTAALQKDGLQLREVMQKAADMRREESNQLRLAFEARLESLQKSNEMRLESMQKTVDEKLQSTLEKRLGESFKQVSERLEAVHKGLGEMQKLSGGVDDLKRVMTNVKTRGVWGEVQLSNLLEQVLTPEQFERNFKPKSGGKAIVEFAIRLPGEGDEPVYLPLDAKFPTEDYQRIIEAADRADPDALETAQKSLEASILSFARDIRDKYISPPRTTDFAVLFLPTEGLYAEVLRRPGLSEKLQNMGIMTAGPTTLLALLNSLRMGFKTLAIQKQSSEIGKVLGAVKTDFGKFGEMLAKVKDKLESASKTVDEAVDRHRKVETKMSKIEALPAGEAQVLLGLDGDAAP